jgi:chromosome segregation ATPase
MLIMDLKADLDSFLSWPEKSLVTAQDLLLAAREKIKELEGEIDGNREAWEDFECAECADLERERDDLQEEVDDLTGEVAKLKAKLKDLGVTDVD